MEPNQKLEPTFEESVADIVSVLPAPIHEYLEKEEYLPVVRSLSQKYRLHVDQAGLLQERLLLLLIGVESPPEFAATLQNKGAFDPAIMTGLMDDLNEQVFNPLQARMRTAGQKPAAPKEAPAVPVMPTIAERTPEPGPRLAAPPPPNLPGAPAQDKPANLLADHEEPHINLSPKAAPVVPQPISAPSAPIPQQPKPVPPSAPKMAASPVPQKYDTDPYHEPIE